VRFFITGLFLLLVMTCVIVAYVDWRGAEPSAAGRERATRIIACVPSPERNSFCIVTESPPPLGSERPFRYRVTITDKNGSPLAGEPLDIDNDSASLRQDDFKITWSENGADLVYAKHFSARVTISGANQAWSRGGQYQGQPSTSMLEPGQ
jgi:hypothetical protein